MRYARKLRLAGALGAVIALGALTAGGTATAGAAAKGPGVTTTIKIKNSGNPRFVGPDTVPAGTSLEIENLTDPMAIGPHTFSLVTKSELPKGKDEIKKCFKVKLVCKDILEAHDFDPSTFEAGQPIVANGLEGWDAKFDGTDPGDSWFTDVEGETHSRLVSATTGTKLRFICAIHPFMQGKIEVGPEL